MEDCEEKYKVSYRCLLTFLGSRNEILNQSISHKFVHESDELFNEKNSKWTNLVIPKNYWIEIHRLLFPVALRIAGIHLRLLTIGE